MEDRGSFSFIAIIYTLVIVIIALSISYYIKSRLSDIEAFNTKTEAYIKIRSYINLINFCLANGSFEYSQVRISTCEDLTESTIIPLDGTQIKLTQDIYISIQDTNGLISISSSDTSVMKRLFMNLLGYSSTQADSLVDSIIDWIDTDDLKRLNGAERFDYVENQPKPRNYFFQYSQELSFVKGMGPKNYQKVKQFITILSNYGFNPNTAPAQVLSAYLDIDMQTAKKVIDYRKTKPITSNAELFYLTGKYIDTSKEGLYFVPYNTFVVRLFYYKNDKVIFSVEMGVSYKGGSYNIIYINID